MTAKPTALGYLRRDVSGVTQAWHETQIRSLASRMGYELAKTVVFGANTSEPLARLVDAVRKIDADAVIVPDLHHIGPDVPTELVGVCEVITVHPHLTYPRNSPSNPFDT
ncbi:recombinase family protein [Nocardia sp. CNY236]|uniref:recombinase family protein n=1 Tax=Nocardia sp. CNY236 TaxID=1169152 RepID=UPI000490E696|nr:recombinase family protein [Nocardia sp. CNY236]